MSKPDWKDAPEWARYLAMDSNGAWYWYEGLPHVDQSESSPYGTWYGFSGKHELAGTYDGWRESLEPRPQ